MYYTIKISGGFAGIQQEFAGELNLTEEKKVALKRTFKVEKQQERNKNLRDYFVYNVKLSIDGKVYKAIYDDGTLPEEILNLLEKIKRNQN